MKSISFITIFALLIFSSCQKDDNVKEEPKPGCRLVKVTQGLDPDTDSVYMFKYDRDGLLDSASFDLLPNGDRYWNDVVYKPGTSLVEKIWLEEIGEELAISMFEYNAQGKPVKAISFIGDEFSYQYNEKGEVTRVDAERWGSPAEYYYETVFDNKGNLIEYYKKFPSNPHLNEGYKVEYTDTENTIAGLSALNLTNMLGMISLFPGSEFLPRPAKYLVKSITHLKANNEPSGTTVSCTFEKDAAQNLTKAIVRYNFEDGSPGAVLTWNFEYDCNAQ